jgi:hypothetical protein
MVDAFFTKSRPRTGGANAFHASFGARVLAGSNGIARSGLCGGRDELLVEHAGQRCLDPVCARALGLLAGE